MQFWVKKHQKQQTDKHPIVSRNSGHERVMILRRSLGSTITESPMTNFHGILMLKIQKQKSHLHSSDFKGFGNKSTRKLLRAPGEKKHTLISSQF